MKKLLVAIVAALALAIPAKSAAQDVFDAGSDNRAYFGVRLSLEAPIPGDWSANKISMKLFKTGVGFDAGAVYNIPLWKNLYFEPGLSLYYNAMGFDSPEYIPGVSNSNIDASVRRFGFRVPFSFGYRFDLEPCSLYAFTGPEFEVGLVGRTHASATVSGQKESESESCYGDNGFLKRVDLAWKFGVGVSVNKCYLGLSGNLGMLNMISNGNGVSMHENLFQLTLGYNF